MFEHKPRSALQAIGVSAYKRWTKSAEWAEDAPIDLGLVRQPAAMSEGIVFLSGLILAKQAPPGPVGQLTGYNFVGKGAHVAGALSLQDGHVRGFVAVQGQREASAQRSRVG